MEPGSQRRAEVASRVVVGVEEVREDLVALMGGMGYLRTAWVGADHFTMGQMERNGVVTDCSDISIHDQESNTLIAQLLMFKMVSKS